MILRLACDLVITAIATGVLTWLRRSSASLWSGGSPEEHWILFLKWFFKILKFLTFLSRHSAPVEVWGRFVEVISLLPPHGFWRLNSGHQAWQLAPSPAEPSWRPRITFYLNNWIWHLRRHIRVCGINVSPATLFCRKCWRVLAHSGPL